MGRGGQGFPPRGMGRPDQGMPPFPDVRPFPPERPEGEDVLIPAPPMQRRGMNRPGPGMPQPDVRPFPPESPEGEDVLVPAPPMQRRGMGRGGRALQEQEPNAPEPGPRGPGRRVN